MSETNRGAVAVRTKRLQRLEHFIDVAYALLFVNFILYLPVTEDMAWTDLPYGLFSLLFENPQQLLRLFIAVGLTLVSWNLTHKLLGPVVQSDTVHTLLVLMQLVVVCFYLYFAIADPELVSISSMVGQSLCLALSGLVGIAGWLYARKQGFADPTMTEHDKKRVLHNVTIEPVTAVLTIGLAFVSSAAWSLGWIAIPAILAALRKAIGWGG